MDEFVNNNNWHVSPSPDATPSPGLPTNMEITSPVSTDEYEISDMEPAEGRGKGKGKVADEEGRRSIVRRRQRGWLRTSSTSLRILSSATSRAAKCYGSGLPRYIILVDQEGRSSVTT